MATTRLVQRTLTGTTLAKPRCHCGKLCKNLKGLKIHQVKAKCSTGKKREERTAVAGEMIEDHSQEQPHSTEDLQPTASSQEQRRRPTVESEKMHGSLTVEKKGRISWPPVNSEEWQKFDEDMDKLLEVLLIGAVEKKLKSMCRSVYCVAEEQFGKLETAKAKRVHQPSRQEREITGIRREIRTLHKRYKRSSEDEREGLKQLRQDLRKRLKELRNAEWIRKNKQDKNKKRAAFIRNLYGFCWCDRGGKIRQLGETKGRSGRKSEGHTF